jgi:AcrR family transcriptional regulator
LTHLVKPGDERRSRETRRAQDDILSAAARVYAECGVEGTTVRRIAEEAGYTPAALYSYFEGKEQIFDGLVHRMRQSLLDTFDVRLPANLDFAHQLEFLLIRQLELLQGQWQACMVFFLLRAMKPHDDACVDAAPHAGFAALPRRLSLWLEQAGAERALAVPCDEAAYLLVGLTIAMFRRWLQDRGAQPLVDVAPRIVHLFLYGAAAPPRSTS